MKTNLTLIPKPILEAAVDTFVDRCERFPGLKVTQNKEGGVATIREVPMHEVVDTTCDALVEVMEIPVFVEYANIEFDFARLAPSVKGVVRVDMMDGKSWLDADFADLGKQRAEYDKASETLKN